jgi:hypothetical protein
MSRRTIAIDLILAVAAAAIVLVASPGVALAAVIALVVLILCGVSFAIERAARRWRRWRG